jgi:hypothetical protein
MHIFNLFPDLVLGMWGQWLTNTSVFPNYLHSSKMVLSSSTQVPGRMMHTPLITKETPYIIPMQSLVLGGE